jgi:hypothetical protein
MMRFRAGRDELCIGTIVRKRLAIPSLLHLCICQDDGRERIPRITAQHLAGDRLGLREPARLHGAIRVAQSIEHANHLLWIRTGAFGTCRRAPSGSTDVAERRQFLYRRRVYLVQNLYLNDT